MHIDGVNAMRGLRIHNRPTAAADASLDVIPRQISLRTVVGYKHDEPGATDPKYVDVDSVLNDLSRKPSRYNEDFYGHEPDTGGA